MQASRHHIVSQEATASPLFDVRAEALETLLGRGRKHTFPAGAVIITANEIVEELYYLHEGLVRQFIITASGVEKFIGMAKPGCLFGEALFLNRCPAQSTAIAVEDSVVYSFSRRTMEDLFEAHPELLMDIARSLSFKIRLLVSQIWVMASDNSESKIGKVLYLLSRDNEEVKPTISLTHQSLADLAGIHRVTVSKALAELTREGILECRRGCVVVKKRDRLLKYRAG